VWQRSTIRWLQSLKIKTNLEALCQRNVKAVIQQITELVNMAKAEALDAVGENRAATELVARYLGV
jgi:hypothetical protein